MKEELAVCLSADVAAEKLRDRVQQAAPHGLEAGERARVREEPLPEAERVGVLGRQRADGRLADVADEGVRLRLRDGGSEVDLAAVVDGAATEQHLAPLVEADAPAERARLATLREQRLVPERRARDELGTVGEESEQACHVEPLLGLPGWT